MIAYSSSQTLTKVIFKIYLLFDVEGGNGNS